MESLFDPRSGHSSLFLHLLTSVRNTTVEETVTTNSKAEFGCFLINHCSPNDQKYSIWSKRLRFGIVVTQGVVETKLQLVNAQESSVHEHTLLLSWIRAVQGEITPYWASSRTVKGAGRSHGKGGESINP